MVSGWSGTADDGAAGIAGVGKIQTRQAGELVNEEPLTKVRLMTFEPSDLSDLKLHRHYWKAQVLQQKSPILLVLRLKRKRFLTKATGPQSGTDHAW